MTKCKKVGSFSRKTTGTLGLKMKVVFCPDLTAQSLVKRVEVVSLIIYYHTKNTFTFTNIDFLKELFL